MTLQEFLVTWNGKYCEVAGSSNALNQCVDLANAYIRDVLGLPIIEWTNAVDFPLKAGDRYEYILNTPTGVPKEGDIVIWKPTPGHIAVFLEGTANTFKSFDQNFPIGSPCHVQNHDYTNVTGWLRAKGTPVSDQECMPKDQAEDFRRCKEGWNKVRALLNVEDNVTVVLAEIDKLIKYEDAVVQKDKQLTDAQVQINMLNGQLKELSESHNALQSSYNNLQGQLNMDKETIDNLKKTLTELEAKIVQPVYKGWKKALIDFIKLI